jgi:hypothetical protein
MHGSFGEQGEDRGADVAPPSASTATAVMARAAKARTEARTAGAEAGAEARTARSEARERRTEPAAAAHAPTVLVRLVTLFVVFVMVVIHDHSSWGLFLDVSTIYR